MPTESTTTSRPPAKPLSKRYIPAILYLADRMSTADRDVATRERTIINQLAEAANMADYKHRRDFLDLDEDKACNALDIETARYAALVVLALILKADGMRKPEEHDFFRKIRTKLQAESVSVPVEMEAHKAFAIKFFG